MKIHQYLIFTVTCILILIVLGDVLNLGAGSLILLALIGQITLIITVIAVLKTPRISNKKFDDYFYEDWGYKRNNSPVSRK